MFKIILFFLIVVSFPLSGRAQGDLERNRVHNFRDFCEYLIKTDSAHIDTAMLFKKFVDIKLNSGLATKTINKQRLDLFYKFCEILRRSVSRSGFEDCELKLAYEFDFVDPSIYSDLINQEKGQIYVRYSYTHPRTPLGFLYFTKDSDKLLSWVLVKESDTYTFFTFK